MKALIIEDEKAAVRNLEALLGEVAPGTKIICTPDSITDSAAFKRVAHTRVACRQLTEVFPFFSSGLNVLS